MNENEKRLLIALEQLNKEYMDLKRSKEYSLGKNIIEIFNYLKKFNIKKIIDFIKNKKKMRHEKNTYKVKEYVKKQEDDYANIENKKIVIYSCITGDYDDIVEPLYCNENVDYILLTNNTKLKSEKWKVMQIPEEIQEQFDNNITLNRFVKINPHKVFKGYEYSIYIDGNIRLISDISCYINNINKDIGIALHQHSKRNCIYDEVLACKRLGKGNAIKMEEQMDKYRKEGYPENNGLLEATMIVTDLKHDISKKIINDWWKEFINSGSYRDQLSLPYVIWKNNIKIEEVGTLGNTIRNNPKIQIIEHKR